MTYEEAIDRDVRTTQVEIDLDQLRNIIYRLENRVIEWTEKCKELEARLETTQHRLDYMMDHSAIQTIMSSPNCDTCD